MDIVNREIRFLKLIREEPHVMCLPCYKSWEGKRLLLVKLVRMVLDYGSLSLTDEPVRTATVNAIEAAEKAGVWISFDPNLRKPLWERFLWFFYRWEKTAVVLIVERRRQRLRHFWMISKPEPTGHGRDACVCECSSINYYNQKRCSSSDARTSRKWLTFEKNIDKIQLKKRE